MCRRPPVVVATAVLAAAVILACGCRREPRVPRLKKSGDASLLLITVDALRADRLDAAGPTGPLMPHCGRLAERGAVFTNVYAPAPQTLPAHSTLFTGREPPAHGVRSDGGVGLPASERTWAEVMREAGFKTYATVSSYRLHSKFGLNRGFDVFDDSLDTGRVLNTLSTAISADKIFLRFRSWLKSRPKGTFFAWVHFSDPRPPYRPLPEFAGLSEKDPYGGGVAQADHYVGEIITLLEAEGLAARTVVVLAGSHGERLHEKREAGDGIFGADEMLKVPVIIRHPELFPKQRRVERRVGLLDVMPTLLELFRLEAPSGIRGKSFLPLLAERRDKRDKEEAERSVYFESRYGVEDMGLAPLSGLIHGPYKLLSLPRDEVYDLRRDPAETNNLALTDKELAAALNDRLRDHLAPYGDREKPGRASDPEGRIEAVARLMKAERLIAADNPDEAEKELESLLRDHPDGRLALAYDHLHFIASMKKDAKKSEHVLRRAAAAHPDIDRFSIALAQLLVDSGRADEAEKICREALAADSRLSQAHILLGNILFRKGENGPALSRMEKALGLEPMNFALQVEYAFQLSESGEKARALGILEKLAADPVLAADPSAVPLRSDIAGVLIKMGEGEMANTLLLDIVSGGRGDGKTWTQIGLGYMEKGDFPKAVESFEKALSLDPDNALALSGMGTIHLALFRGRKEKEDLEAAVAFYMKAKESSPGLVAAWNGLGVAWSYAGDREKAIAHWRQALLIDPGFTNTYFNLGITLLQSGRKEEARDILSVCLEKYAHKLSRSELRQIRALIEEASR